MFNEAATYLNYILPNRPPSFDAHVLKQLRKAHIEKNNLINVSFRVFHRVDGENDAN